MDYEKGKNESNHEWTLRIRGNIKKLNDAAPDLLESCKEALSFVKLSRQYFPKTIKNKDKFTLETTCASLGKAIHKAEGQ